MQRSTLKIIIATLIFLSLVGIILSAHLTQTHYQEKSKPQICDINDRFSCSTVNTSSYSEIFGISVAIFGLFWFIITIFLTMNAGIKKSWVRPLHYWALLGLLSIIYFIYAEFQIGSVCLYCTAVHLIIIITSLLTYYLYKQSNHNVY